MHGLKGLLTYVRSIFERRYCLRRFSIRNSTLISKDKPIQIFKYFQFFYLQVVGSVTAIS